MLGTAKFLTLEAAKKMAAAGEAAARQNGWNVALAIVDQRDLDRRTPGEAVA